MTGLNIVFEDEVLLVCNKPAGLMVEPDRNNHLNLLDQVKKYLKVKLESNDIYVQHLHRLDRVTSGIVLFTKNKSHLRNLSEQFAQREVTKTYLALTKTKPEQMAGRLEHWLRKEKKKAILYKEEIEFAEKAILEYDVSVSGANFLWNIHLLTGKYHQIRAQLASLNCPIIGDELYCSTETWNANAIALHAWKLKIRHPVNSKEMELVAPCDLLNY